MATTIDNTWISGAGTPPFVLNTDNEVYTLTVDVNITSPSSFNGPVFKLTGKNQFLDLNGHYVKINGWVVDQPALSFKGSGADRKAVSANVINNTTGGVYCMGKNTMSTINVDPTDKEKKITA